MWNLETAEQILSFFFSSSNLQDLSKGIKMIAGLLDDDDDGKNLLDATRGLAGAFSNLLKAAQEGGGADSEVSKMATFPVMDLRD